MVLKVVEITQEKLIPFKNGIPSWRWLQWFKKGNPDLSLCVTQGFEVGCTKRLCPTNVVTFYDNLQHVYILHDYDANRIWNCDESDV
jgi:hypothetical protein